MKIEKTEAYRTPNGGLYKSVADARRAMVVSEIHHLFMKQMGGDKGGYAASAAYYLVSFFECNHEKIYEIMKAANEDLAP